jgi:hypothetical protein
MGEYQLRSWVGWRRHRAMVMLAMFFMLQQKILLAAELPLLSAEDIAWQANTFFPGLTSPSKTCGKHSPEDTDEGKSTLIHANAGSNRTSRIFCDAVELGGGPVRARL